MKLETKLTTPSLSASDLCVCVHMHVASTRHDIDASLIWVDAWLRSAARKPRPSRVLFYMCVYVCLPLKHNIMSLKPASGVALG